MSKHIYRSTGVKAANWEWIAEQARTEGPGSIRCGSG
jgi:hypothetical protein